MMPLVAAALAASLVLSADPSALRPGGAPRARLTLEVRSAAVAPETELPRLAASVGTIENVHAAGPGKFVAEYVPPDEGIPQVALLSATLSGETSFLALPIYGLGDAEVRTRPRGRITVRIGEERFGPVQADARGVAEVPVVVPPGVREAFHGSEPIDLHVPPSRTLHLALSVDRVPADAAAEVAVRLFVVDPRGAPRPGVAPRLRASEGEVGRVADLGGGIYGATWRLAVGPPGEPSISAVLEDAPAFVAEAKVLRPPGAASTLELSADRQRLVAGQDGDGPMRLLLRASLRDAAGNPADDALLVAPSLGTAEVTAAAVGLAQAVVSVPATFGEARDLTIAVRCARGRATASLAVPLVPAPPAQARVELSTEASARADGETPLALRVLLSDRFGNPVPDAPLVAEADAGAVSAPLARGGGAYLVTYTPPLLLEEGSALVRVRAGEAQGSLRIPLAAGTHLLAVTPRLGVLSNFHRISSPLASVEGSLRFDLLGQPFAALLEAGWFFSSHTDAPSVAPQVSTRDDFVLLSAGLSFRPEIAARTRAFFSLSPSLALLRSRQQFAGQPELSQSAAVPGFLLGAGLEYRLPRFTPLLEARFSFTRDPRLSNLRQPVRGFALLLGSRFEAL